MWDLPGPGIEPLSPALAGGFLTTGPPGKSPGVFIIFIVVSSTSKGDHCRWGLGGADTGRVESADGFLEEALWVDTSAREEAEATSSRASSLAAMLAQLS